MNIDPVLPQEQAAGPGNTNRQTPQFAEPPTATPDTSLSEQLPGVVEPVHKTNSISTLEEWAATHTAEPSTHMSVEQAVQKVVGPNPAASSLNLAKDYPPRASGTAVSGSTNEPQGAQSRHTPKSQSETPGPSTIHRVPFPSTTQSETLRGITTPPYHPPSQVNYAVGKCSNPYFQSREYKPILDGVMSNNLFRPEFFPLDLDERLAKSSIWMGIDKNSREPRYFVPASCAECSDPSLRRYCDRAYPKCGHCASTQKSCSPGTTWRFLRTSKRKPDDGKPDLKRSSSQVESNGNGNGPSDGAALATGPSEGGRGKRVKKKRRLSADQIDPETLDDEGNPRPLGTATLSFRTDTPGQTSTSGKASAKISSRPRSSLPNKALKPDQPISKADEEYFRLLEENAQKPQLRDMRGACPVWSHTRRALCSATEYLRNPIRSEGASVEVGKGGIARGVILEGRPPGRPTFWGTTMEVNGVKQSMAGTIMANIGRSRPIHRPDSQAQDAPSPARQELLAGPDSPTIHVVNAARALRTTDGPFGESSKSPSVPPNVTAPTERVEIDALRQAQKYGTPVAVALAGDYEGVPFKVPRKFIVLGWFWIIDAWLEPVSSRAVTQGAKPDHVVWRFRFEWCEPQAQPWWTSRSDPARNPTPTVTHVSTPAGQGLRLHSDKPTILPPGQTELDKDFYAICPACQYASKMVYAYTPTCLNEPCTAFGQIMPRNGQIDRDRMSAVGSRLPHPVMPVERVTPDSLSLQLRPPLPSGEEREGRKWAGKEWWRAWVCDDCGQANERRSWSEWDCQACGRIIQFPRKHYDAFFLRDPSRPVCDGPRQDDGVPNWPFETTMAWTLFKDDIKVIKHGVDVPDGLGEKAEVFHALNTEGKMSHVASNLVLRGLQSQGKEELSLTRYIQPNATVRPSEQYLSPFYTMLCGDEAPALDHFPVGPAVPWSQSLQQTLDAIDLINERVGRMWPGTKERFNSLLIAAFPPELPSGLAPHITVQPGDHLGLLFLGSDGEIRFKASFGANRRFGTLKYQHGDVIGVKASELPIEVVLKPEGFGFVCLGRMTYRPKSAGMEVDDMDIDFPALPNPNQNPSSQSKPKPRESLPTSTSNGSAAVTSIPKTKSANKPKLLEKASIEGWYIGSRPINSKEPLRSLPVLEERRNINVPNPPRTFRMPGDDDTSTDPQPPTWTGVLYISTEDVQAVTRLETGVVQSLEDKKAKKKGKKGEGKESEGIPAPEHNIVSGLKGKGKGKRASTVSTGIAEEMTVNSEPGTPTSATSRASAKVKGKTGRSSLGGAKAAASKAGTTPTKSAPKARRKSTKKTNGEPSSNVNTPSASSPPPQDTVVVVESRDVRS